MLKKIRHTLCTPAVFQHRAGSPSESSQFTHFQLSPNPKWAVVHNLWWCIWWTFKEGRKVPFYLFLGIRGMNKKESMINGCAWQFYTLVNRGMQYLKEKEERLPDDHSNEFSQKTRSFFLTRCSDSENSKILHGSLRHRPLVSFSYPPTPSTKVRAIAHCFNCLLPHAELDGDRRISWKLTPQRYQSTSFAFHFEE